MTNLTPDTSDLAAQRHKKGYHLVQCHESNCVHWLDDQYHWYHTQCQADVAAGKDYRLAMTALREHMDSCSAEVTPTMVPDPEVIHDGV